MAAGLDFQFSFRASRAAKRRGGGDVFRILLLGDFSGKAGRQRPLPERAPVRVDADNFEAVFRALAPRLELTLPDGGVTALAFSRLEDFHADALYQRLPQCAQALALRPRLLNPATFAAAAAELQGADGRPGGESEQATLDRLLGSAQPQAAPVANAAARPGGVLDMLLKQAVGTGAVAAPSPQRDTYLAALDAASADSLRQVLHHPEFQALEAAWLGLRGLVSTFGGDEEIRLELWDVSDAELDADLLSSAGDQSASATWNRLVEGGPGAPGGEAWSVLVFLGDFGPAAEELKRLAFLGSVAAGVGAPFLAGAAPALLGLPSLAGRGDPRDWPGLSGDALGRWQALRRSSLGQWIGLALPRVLLRLPYGKRGEPCESFPFEEMGNGFRHESCLWGSAAPALAQLLAQSFLDSGADMEPGEVLDLEDLPAFVHEVDGEKQLLPCAELLLGERAGEDLLARGFMPILSYRDRNAARLMRFQSIAEPIAPLAGLALASDGD